MDSSDPLERAVRPRDRGETWTDEQFRAAREHDLTERTIAAPRVVIAVLGCLLLALLLTTGKLVEIAERQEFGDARDRNLALAEGVDRVANFLSLNRPYDSIRDLRDANNDRTETAGVVTTTTTTAAPATTITPADESSATTSTTSTTTTTTLSPGRDVTADEPLRVYVAGDSQATYLGQAITSERDGLALDVAVDDRISTSLARPDYFDWPTRWAAQMLELDPEVVVLFIGANDHQDMVDAAGERLVEGSEPWRVEWRARMTTALDIVAADGRAVLWVTQPPMRDGDLDAGVRVINEIADEVLADRDDVTVVDIWDLFGGDGDYRERLSGPDGETITARVGDGVHLSRSAASWVADLVFAELDGRFTFES
ncbi:MAG: DUF459 domain-containing protein [Actinomycetota bacterium]